MKKHIKPTPTPTNGRVIQEVPMIASVFASKGLILLMLLFIVAAIVRLFIR